MKNWRRLPEPDYRFQTNGIEFNDMKREYGTHGNNGTDRRLSIFLSVPLFPCVPYSRSYSWRKATIGSTFIARRAGMKQASDATIDNVAETVT